MFENYTHKYYVIDIKLIYKVNYSKNLLYFNCINIKETLSFKKLTIIF